jgi:hypothetical protein
LYILRVGFGIVVALALGTSELGCCAASPSAGLMPAPTTPGQSPVAARALSDSVPAPVASVAPRTADECRACNGVWGTHGIAETESCNCRTRDSGKRCRDGADCQGMCIAAEEPEREIVQAGPPPRGFFIGRCSDLVTVFGCNRIIEVGATVHGPVPLHEPPMSICVD